MTFNPCAKAHGFELKPIQKMTPEEAPVLIAKKL